MVVLRATAQKQWGELMGLTGVGVVVVILFAVVALNGICMLVAPARHKRFLAWLMQTNSWSRRGDDEIASRGLELERRLAGLGLALLGTFAVVRMVQGTTPVQRSRPSAGSSVSSIGSEFLPWAFGIASLALGVFILVRPALLVRWILKHQLQAGEVPQSTLSVWRRASVAMGVLILSGGFYALWVAIQQTGR